MRALFRFRVRRFPEVSSTNSFVRAEAAKGAAEGLVVSADYQTSGRGKPGRVWVSSPKKNLLFSVLVRPPIRAHQAPILTQIACRSVARVLEESCGVRPSFKRPNDLLVRGKKICGVLVESASSNGWLESAVIGIGLNVNARSAELLPHATSVRTLKRKTFSRAMLMRQILSQLRNDLVPLYAESRP